MDDKNNKIEECIFIAGVFYYKNSPNNLESIIKNSNFKNHQIDLIRDSENEHDIYALRVVNEQKETIGYIPRNIVQYLSPLVDDHKIKISALLENILNYSGSMLVLIKVSIELLKQKKLFGLFELNKKVTNDRWYNLKKEIDDNYIEELGNIKIFDTGLEKKSEEKMDEAICQFNKIKNSSRLFHQSQTEKQLCLNIINAKIKAEEKQKRLLLEVEEERKRLKKEEERLVRDRQKRDEDLIKIGRNLIKKGKYEGFGLLEEVSKFHPKYKLIINSLPKLKEKVIEENYSLGLKLYEKKNWFKAIENLAQIPADSTLYNKVKKVIEEASYNNGKLFFDMKEWVLAISSFEKVSNDSTYFNKAKKIKEEASYNLGKKYFKEKKWDEAIEKFMHVSVDSNFYEDAKKLIELANEETKDKQYYHYFEPIYREKALLESKLAEQHLGEEACDNIKEQLNKIEKDIQAKCSYFGLKKPPVSKINCDLTLSYDRLHRWY